jgi:hypothetical protein
MPPSLAAECAYVVLGYSIQLKLFFILSLSMNLFVPTLVGGFPLDKYNFPALIKVTI